MNKLYAALVLASALAWGTVALRAAPTRSAGLFTDSPANASVLTTDTLQPPTGLVAVASVNPGEIDLSWTASASGYASGYNVYRSTSSGGGYALVTFVPGWGSTTYPDTGLVTGTPYFYVVQATYQNWTSGYSNEGTDTPN
jgi:Fibronectin type III domain